MPTTITSAGVTFNDTTSLTSANIGTAQLVNGSVTAAKLGTNEQKQIAKAWVNFNGTTSPGTIRSSYNVSSVTKNGNGNYTVNFTVGALADANYSWSGSTDGYLNVTSGAYVNLGPTGTYPIIKTTSNLRIIIQDQTSQVINGSEISVQIFGN